MPTSKMFTKPTATKKRTARVTVTEDTGPPLVLSRDREELLLSKCVDPGTRSKLINAPSTNAGVIPWYDGALYLYQEEHGAKFTDAGGKKRLDERMMETALRECQEEIGIKPEDITKVHGVVLFKNYSVIVAEVDKRPVAQTPGSSVKRVEEYATVIKDGGRLGCFVNKGLPKLLKKIEDAYARGGTTTTTKDDATPLVFSDLFLV
jgi:hypothetical protein